MLLLAVRTRRSGYTAYARCGQDELGGATYGVERFTLSLVYKIHSLVLLVGLGAVWAITSTYGSVRRAVDGNGHRTLLSSSMGFALFFLGEYANMIPMRCGALHLTFVGPLPAGASVPGPYLTEQSSLRGINIGPTFLSGPSPRCAPFK